MPQVTPSTYRTFHRDGKKVNAITASYNFTGDAPKLITTVPGRQIQGVEYIIDTKAIQGVADFPAIKTVLVSAQFVENAGGVFADGGLLIFESGSNTLLQFGANGNDNFQVKVYSLTTAMVPIVTADQPRFSIIKENGGGGIPNVIGGGLFITFFDIELPAYSNQGFSNFFSYV